MALPTSRNTTYTPDDPIKSNDLNAIQDAIVGLDDDIATLENTTIPQNVRHGNIKRFFPAMNSGANTSVIDWVGTFYLHIAGLYHGDRIKSIEHMYNTSTATVTFTIRQAINVGGVVFESIGASWEGSGGDTSGFPGGVNVTGGGVPYLIGASAWALFIGVVASSSAVYYGSFVTWDHP